MLAHNEQVTQVCGGGMNRPCLSLEEEEEGEEAEEAEGPSLYQPAVHVRGRTGGMQAYACANNNKDIQVRVWSLLPIMEWSLQWSRARIAETLEHSRVLTAETLEPSGVEITGTLQQQSALFASRTSSWQGPAFSPPCYL